ncbi:FAD-dependent oxidoreductase [Actinomadura sp. 6N118]|uniref:FAD-dependent oxidoreductase n=1 Tax=Actinomadura sp. 6N118 TaxID=3375151 RepID=UPI00378A793A
MDPLPETTLSYWVDSAPGPFKRDWPPLPDEADVLVLGAGIAGLTTAYLLARAGRSVTVLEAARIAEGVSGHTTAKVTSQHNLIYAELTRRYGLEKAGLYGESQQAAIDWIATQVGKLGVDCDFRRRHNHVYAEDPSYLDTLRNEAEAATELGLPAEFVPDVDLPFRVAGAVRFRDQAQFHPRKWLLALAEAITEAGGRILEGVRATGLGRTDESLVHTSAGDVRARDVVVTTHYPVFDRGAFFSRLIPKRVLLMAAPADSGALFEGMYIAADTGHSMRTTPDGNGGEMLLLGGAGYHPGEEPEVEERFRKLAAWGEDRLKVGRFSHRWATQDNSSIDRLPYIGRYHPLAKHLWVAAGFGLWGMTNGTVAGLLLADLISGNENPWSRLYDPARLNVRQSASKLASLSLKTGLHYTADYPRAFAPGDKIAELRPGEGTVTHLGRHPVAAHRDAEGRLTAVSAVCTHLGCLVAFNDAEQTWDCPCHGSRFTVDGSVHHGPATKPLKPIKIDEAPSPEAPSSKAASPKAPPPKASSPDTSPEAP